MSNCGNAEGAETLCWCQTFAQRWCRMDLDSFLVSLYVLVDDWWQEHHPSSACKRKPGRPALLSDPEVITLAILAQWPRFRSERDFWRFASAHLRRCETSASPGTKGSQGSSRKRVLRSPSAPL